MKIKDIREYGQSVGFIFEEYPDKEIEIKALDYESIEAVKLYLKNKYKEIEANDKQSDLDFNQLKGVDLDA